MLYFFEREVRNWTEVAEYDFMLMCPSIIIVHKKLKCTTGL